MSDVNRRGFLGMLGGIAAASTVTASSVKAERLPKVERPLVYQVIHCPRCGCQMPFPDPSDVKYQPKWQLFGVQSTCGCGYSAVVRFYVEQCNVGY